jgi:hypothetical protein
MSEIGIGREGLGWISMAALESCTRLPIWSSCASLTRLDRAVWFLDACASTIGQISQIWSCDRTGLALQSVPVLVNLSERRRRDPHWRQI